jgi:hypothetical protein
MPIFVLEQLQLIAPLNEFGTLLRRTKCTTRVTSSSGFVVHNLRRLAEATVCRQWIVLDRSHVANQPQSGPKFHHPREPCILCKIRTIARS